MFDNEVMDIDGLDELEVQNTAIDDLDSEDVNLMMIGIDNSSSMYPYMRDMSKCLAEFKDALENSKDAGQILVARADFADYVDIGGYKKINEFSTDYNPSGCTALNDAIVLGATEMMKYRDFLRQQGVRVKCVFAMFSDGYDNNSRADSTAARQIVDKLNAEEITTAYIAFGGDAEASAKVLHFKNLLKVDSTAEELRRAFNCLSKSVIESSKSVLADDDDFFV